MERKDRHVLFLEKKMASLFDGFRMILIDIFVLWKEKKDVYYFWKENA
jgi:hypothetical protein